MKRQTTYITKTIEDAVTTTTQVIDPVRQSLFKRFPILLTLLITFGVSATFLGAERLIGEIAWLHDRPFVIFLLGLSTLLFTGKLYQKLG